MRREYSPYPPPSEPETQDKKPLPWSHMIISGAVGIVIGVVTMVGASAVIGSPAKPTTVPGGPDYVIGGGIEQAVNHLEEKGIYLPQERLQEIEDVACNGLADGRSSNNARKALKYQSWDGLKLVMPETKNVYDEYASEALAAVVITSCPENIGKLALNPEED